MPIPKDDVPVDVLKRLLDLDPETGRLTWRPRTPSDFDCKNMPNDERCAIWNSRHAGKLALNTIDGKGYLCGRVNTHTYKAHRVAWAIFYGEWPQGQIDHINRVRTDNRIANLRSVTGEENCRNISMRKNNSSGRTGVQWDSSRNRWVAKICVNSKQIRLGSSRDFTVAVKMREDAEIKYGYRSARTPSNIFPAARA